jgi:hypothetical protein
MPIHTDIEEELTESKQKKENYTHFLGKKKLAQKIKHVKKKFDSPVMWREVIWNKCPFKEEVQTENLIFFVCKKTRENCEFRKCPENLAKKENSRKKG